MTPRRLSRTAGNAPAIALALSALLAPPARGQAEAENLSASFRRAARRVLPAVVTVRALGEAPTPLVSTPFVQVQVGPPPKDAGGSGVVIDAARGLVLTNDHVIELPTPARSLLGRREILPAPRLVVTLPDGRERPVREVRRDPRSDLALLTIDPQGLNQAEWGDSDALDTGDWVLAVGQPFGLSNTVTAGIVSGKGRGLGLVQNEDLIQTDAAINPGNSGGPLVNLKGEVVGINTAIRSLNGGYDGVGFALPAARARRVAADLAALGRVRRSYLGIRIGRLDPEAAPLLVEAGGVPVAAVAPGGPAATAGLRPGDIIYRIAGKPVGGTGSLQAAIEAAAPGEPLTLSVSRGGQEVEITVRPEAQADGGPGSVVVPDVAPVPPPPPPPPRPAAEPPLVDPAPVPGPADPADRPEARSPTRFPDLGLRLAEPAAPQARRFGVDPAARGLVVVGVEPDGPADRAGVELGMVITDAAERKVSTLPEFRAALARRRAGRDLILRVLKGAKPGFRVLLGRPAPPEGPPPPDGPILEPIPVAPEPPR